MTGWRNSPKKNSQEGIITINLLKVNKSNISEQEFITVIRLLVRLEKSIENTRETYRDQRPKNES